MQKNILKFNARTAEFAREKDQPGLCQHIKSLKLEGKKGCGSAYIRNTAGELWGKQAMV